MSEKSVGNRGVENPEEATEIPVEVSTEVEEETPEISESSSEVVRKYNPNLNPEGKPRIDHDTLLLELSEVVTATDHNPEIEQKINLLKQMASGEIPEDPSVIDDVIEFLDDYQPELQKISDEKEAAPQGLNLSEEDVEAQINFSRFQLERVLKKENEITERTDDYSRESFAVLGEIQELLGQKEGLTVSRINEGREKIANLRKTLQGRLDRKYGQTESNVQYYTDHETRQLIQSLDAADIALEEMFYVFGAKNEVLDLARVGEWKEDLVRWQERMQPQSESPVEPEPVVPEPEPIVTAGEGAVEKIFAVDASPHLRAMAQRIAENKLNEIINGRSEIEGTGLTRMFNRMRRFGDRVAAKLGEGRYLTKLYNEAYKELEDNQDLRTTIEARLRGESEGVVTGSEDKSETYEVLDAIMEQFENDVMEREENGELIAEGGQYFVELFQRHIRGEVADRKEFEAEVRKIVDDLVERGIISRDQFSGESGREAEAEGAMYATNLWEIAEARKNEISEKYGEQWEQLTDEQRESVLENVASIGDLDLQLGLRLADLEDSRAQRPGTRNEYVSRIEEALSRACRLYPALGVIMNPTVVGIGSSVLTSRALRGVAMLGVGAAGLSGGAAMLAPLAVGAGVAATMAYFRRSRNLKFDRGLEQRREALGEAGEGRRAAALRERGFSEIAENASDLISRIEAGDAGAVLEARARLEVQRNLRRSGANRGVDLIFVDSEEAERTGTNVVSLTKLKLAIKAFESEKGELSDDRVAERMAEIESAVYEQDDSFEKYRRSEARTAAAASAVTAAVLGLAAQEITDAFLENLAGVEANDQITAYERFIEGQESQLPAESFYSLGEDVKVLDGHVDTELIKLPGSDQEVEVVRTLVGNNGNPEWKVEVTDLPAGYAFNPETLTVTREFGEVSGNTLSNWSEIREQLADRFGLETGRASWIKFGNNGTPGRYDGTELKMDFLPNKDGSVDLSIDRMLGQKSFGDGHSFVPTEDSMDKVVYTLSQYDPGAGTMDNEAIILTPGPDGRVTIDPELASIVFDSDGDLKNNFLITASEKIGFDHGKTRLFSMAAQYGGDPSEIQIDPRVDSFTIENPDIEFVPAVEEMVYQDPIATPVDRRRPIGDPEKPEKTEAEGNPDPVSNNGNEGTPANNRSETANGRDILNVPGLTQLNKTQLNELYTALSGIKNNETTEVEKKKLFTDYLDANYSKEVADDLKHVQTGNEKRHIRNLTKDKFETYVAIVMRRIDEMRRA